MNLLLLWQAYWLKVCLKAATDRDKELTLLIHCDQQEQALLQDRITLLQHKLLSTLSKTKKGVTLND
jgi:hypothetical protein